MYSYAFPGTAIPASYRSPATRAGSAAFRKLVSEQDPTLNVKGCWVEKPASKKKIKNESSKVPKKGNTIKKKKLDAIGGSQVK